jgi:predicted alpha/beta-hydrolase family hydrolase
VEGTREELRVEITPSMSVTALAYPATARDRAGITLIIGHGAGAGQTSDFMVSLATELAARGFDALTFNFFYMQCGRRIPDPNDKLEACYRAVIETARNHAKFGRNALVIGGKSMGGRIASQIAAAGAGSLAGLVLFGYPLHPPGRPEKLRTKHLADIKAPMLFVQGSRDAFGTPHELQQFIGKLKARVKLCVVEGGDHSFKVLKSSSLTQQEVYKAIYDQVADWLHESIVR